MIKHLVRPDDYEIFSSNKDGTYSRMEMKEQFPNNLHHSYPEKLLLKLGFYFIKEREIPLYKVKGKEYRDQFYKTLKYDGHGGYDYDE